MASPMLGPDTHGTVFIHTISHWPFCLPSVKVPALHFTLWPLSAPGDLHLTLNKVYICLVSLVAELGAKVVAQ